MGGAIAAVMVVVIACVAAFIFLRRRRREVATFVTMVPGDMTEVSSPKALESATFRALPPLTTTNLPSLTIPSVSVLSPSVTSASLGSPRQIRRKPVPEVDGEGMPLPSSRPSTKHSATATDSNSSVAAVENPFADQDPFADPSPDDTLARPPSIFPDTPTSTVRLRPCIASCV